MKAMAKRLSIGFVPLGLILVVGCSNPYQALMTPELMSRVDNGATTVSSAQSGQICPDLQASDDEAYGGHRNLSSDGGVLAVTVLAGGRADLAQCLGFEGFTSIKPDVALDIHASGGNLSFEIKSTQDTVLLVQSPSGTLSFDDDSGEGSNAAVSLTQAERGTYLLWVGTFSADSAFKPRVTLTANYNKQ